MIFNFFLFPHQEAILIELNTKNIFLLLLAGVLLFALGYAVCGYFNDDSAALVALKERNAELEQLAAQAEERREETNRQLTEATERINALTIKNAEYARQVTQNAYQDSKKKTSSMSGTELVAAYNDFIAGARSRNAERERAVTSADK